MMRCKVEGMYISFPRSYKEMVSKYSNCQVSFDEWQKADDSLKTVII